MKAKVIFLFLMIIGICSYAQNENEKSHITKPEKPILIINNEIISSIDILDKIPPEYILKLEIFKDEKLSSDRLFSTEKDSIGIIKADIDYKFNYKTQKELNIFLGLEQSNSIYVNNYLIKDKKILISTESIKKIELIQADDIFLKKSSINIIIE